MPKPNNLTMNPGNLLAGPPHLPNNTYGIEELPDGSAVMSYRISIDVLKKLRCRAGVRPLDRYIYENILYPNTINHVY